MSRIEFLMQYNRWWGPFSENLIYLLAIAIIGYNIISLEYTTAVQLSVELLQISESST